MKRWKKTSLTVGTALLAIAVAGCAAPTSYEGPPPEPVCETDEQRVTVDVCKAIYSCCTRDCANTKLRSGQPRAPEECMAACAANLEACYQQIE